MKDLFHSTVCAATGGSSHTTTVAQPAHRDTMGNLTQDPTGTGTSTVHVQLEPTHPGRHF
jgi:hypothetical protein